MNKSSIAILAVLVIIGAAFYFSKNRGASNPGQQSLKGSEEVVEYTNSGYSPQTIRVKAGTAVNFVNRSDNPMWTASDPHPTHTVMHGFDAMRAMMRGESFSFTFTGAGTWRYHNHMVPGHMGSVIVE